MCLSSKATVIFRGILKDEAVCALLKLLAADDNDAKAFIELYSDFVSALYKKCDNLTEYLNRILQNDENIYVKEAAKGEAK